MQWPNIYESQIQDEMQSYHRAELTHTIHIAIGSCAIWMLLMLCNGVWRPGFVMLGCLASNDQTYSSTRRIVEFKITFSQLSPFPCSVGTKGIAIANWSFIELGAHVSLGCSTIPILLTKTQDHRNAVLHAKYLSYCYFITSDLTSCCCALNNALMKAGLSKMFRQLSVGDHVPCARRNFDHFIHWQRYIWCIWVRHLFHTFILCPKCVAKPWRIRLYSSESLHSTSLASANWVTTTSMYSATESTGQNYIFPDQGALGLWNERHHHVFFGSMRSRVLNLQSQTVLQ